MSLFLGISNLLFSFLLALSLSLSDSRSTVTSLKRRIASRLRLGRDALLRLRLGYARGTHVTIEREALPLGEGGLELMSGDVIYVEDGAPLHEGEALVRCFWCLPEETDGGEGGEGGGGGEGSFGGVAFAGGGGAGGGGAGRAGSGGFSAYGGWAGAYGWRGEGAAAAAEEEEEEEEAGGGRA